MMGTRLESACANLKLRDTRQILNWILLTYSENHRSQNWTSTRGSLEIDRHMAHTARVKSKVGNGVPHLPFQEFNAPSLEALLGLLKKAQIKDSEIEISNSEDAQHTMCSRPLVHVLVMTAKGEGAGEYKDLAALYQYCPECHLAVRVL